MIANVWLSLNITTLNAMLQFLVIHRYRFLNLGKLFLNCRTNSRKKKKKVMTWLLMWPNLSIAISECSNIKCHTLTFSNNR